MEKIYDIIDTSKIIISITDSYLMKYYPWLVAVVEKYHIKLYANHCRVYNSINFIDTMIYKIPLPKKLSDDSEVYLDNKEKIIVDCCNFKGCKHKQLVFDYPFLFKKYKIIEFGSTEGICYNEFCKIFKSKVDWDINIKGWVSYTEIGRYLKKAIYGLDLSRFSNSFVNMDNIILEYIEYGVIPVTLLPLGDEPLRIIDLSSPEDIGKFYDEGWRKEAACFNYESLKTNYNYLDICKK